MGVSLAQVSALLDGFASALGSPSKAVRLAAVTLLLNAAVLNGEPGLVSSLQVVSC